MLTSPWLPAGGAAHTIVAAAVLASERCLDDVCCLTSAIPNKAEPIWLLLQYRR